MGERRQIKIDGKFFAVQEKWDDAKECIIFEAIEKSKYTCAVCGYSDNDIMEFDELKEGGHVCSICKTESEKVKQCEQCLFYTMQEMLTKENDEGKDCKICYDCEKDFEWENPKVYGHKNVVGDL